MRAQYTQLVTPALLEAWLVEPASAPGRQVSSPWPDGIAIRSIDPAAVGCRVEADVLYITSADTAAALGAPERVSISVSDMDGWRISAYEVSARRVPARPEADGPVRSEAPGTTGAADAALDAQAAVEIIEDYYAAINGRDYRRAYELWNGAGEASGQSFAEFAGGFEGTVEVRVDIGSPGRVEGAAGSRYVAVPIELVALHGDGRRESFAGTYTLRRAVVDGASTEERSWRIHSADIVRR
jgi:hypothetical protein